MIKIQTDEYDVLLNETYMLHKESKEIIRDYIRELEELLAPGGGFYAEQVSQKIKLLLEILREKLLPDLEVAFDETERQMLLLARRLAESDEERSFSVKWKR